MYGYSVDNVMSVEVVRKRTYGVIHSIFNLRGDPMRFNFFVFPLQIQRLLILITFNCHIEMMTET